MKIFKAISNYISNGHESASNTKVDLTRIDRATDPYDVLGVRPSDPFEQVERAHAKLHKLLYGHFIAATIFGCSGRQPSSKEKATVQIDSDGVERRFYVSDAMRKYGRGWLPKDVSYETMKIRYIKVERAWNTIKASRIARR